MRYLIAIFFTLCMGERIIFHNIVPEWYWCAISLTSMLGTISFGIVEKAYKKEADLTIRRYPCTNIGIIVTGFSEIMAIIQFVFIML